MSVGWGVFIGLAVQVGGVFIGLDDVQVGWGVYNLFKKSGSFRGPSVRFEGYFWKDF